MGNRLVKRSILHKVILASIVLLSALGMQTQVLAANDLPAHSPIVQGKSAEKGTKQNVKPSNGKTQNTDPSDQTDGDCNLEVAAEQQTISYAGLIKLAGKTKRDLKKYISVKKFAAKSKQYIKIDIREPEQFEKYHLIGSINIDPFALKGKNYFKEQKLVIIDSGYRFSEVENLVKDLEEKGFKSVRILDGGITAWTRYGGKVDGDLIEAEKVNQITAQEYEIQQRYSGWQPIILRNKEPKKATLIQMPNSIEIDIRDKKETQVIDAINKQITSLLDQNKDPEILLIAGKDIKEWYAPRLATKIAYPNLYIMQDGIQGYIQQAKKRQLAANYDGRKKGAVKCSQK